MHTLGREDRGSTTCNQDRQQESAVTASIIKLFYRGSSWFTQLLSAMTEENRPDAVSNSGVCPTCMTRGRRSRKRKETAYISHPRDLFPNVGNLRADRQTSAESWQNSSMSNRCDDTGTPHAQMYSRASSGSRNIQLSTRSLFSLFRGVR